MKASWDGPLWADRLARYAWRVLLAAVALGLPGCVLLRWTCEVHPRYGLDITGQWHQLVHMLVGAVPMVALYGWALRVWRAQRSDGYRTGRA